MVSNCKHFISRHICLLFSLLTLAGFTGASAQGVKFDESLTWEQVKAKAKAENKYILMDVFATWCGPCKAMDKDVYPSEELGTAVNDKFISVKVQADSSKKDNDYVKSWYADARNLMQQYKINAFPTFLFFSPDGKLVHKDLGYKDVKAFSALAKEATDANKQYYVLAEKYKTGKLDAASTMLLARRARAFKETEFASSVANRYIKGLKKTAVFEKENLQFIREFTRSAKDPGFAILYGNIAKVNSVLGEDEAEGTITAAIENDEVKPFMKKDSPKPDWATIQKNTTAKYGKLGEELAMQSQVLYAVNNNDWELFGKVAKPWFEQYGSKRKWIGSFLLNNVAWAAFEKTSDKQGLEGALAMSAKTIENGQGGPTEWDTYANLLYKLGQKEKALEWEAKAAAGAPDDKGIQEAYEKMKKGEPSWPAK